MTNDQIKAELRRSAVEDRRPWLDVDIEAFLFVSSYWTDGDLMLTVLTYSTARTLFLLVAEAM